MTWVKITDDFWRNRKVRKAWRDNPSSIGLYVLALAYCNERNGLGEDNDGFIDPGWLSLTFASLNGAGEEAAKSVVETLVVCGLWEDFGDGWQIHDYLEFQPSAKRIQEITEARRMAGAMGAKKRWSGSKGGGKR